jgi:hypothetical protein
MSNKQTYQEWESPCGPSGDHFLNQLSTRGFFKTDTQESANNKTISVQIPLSEDQKIKVYAVVNITNIQSIDISAETFTCRLRLYLMWSIDNSQEGYEHFVPLQKKAQDSGHYYSLQDSEVEEFTSKITIPTIQFLNATEIEVLDDIPSIRIYGGKKGAILWNCGYIAKFKEYFPLQLFPFDHQELTLELGQEDSRTWNKFDLTVCSVQFHSKALELPEWKMFEPMIKRNPIAHKATTVTLQVKRKPTYFVNNIVAIMMMLSLLCLVVFAIPADELNDRVEVILTLFLTAVAFKLVISDSIPKVGYSTLIDNFVLGNMIFLFSTVMLCTAGFLISNTLLLTPEQCGISPFCHAAFYIGYFVDYLTITVNGLMFFCSILFFTGMNLHWLFSVIRREQHNLHLQPLTKQDGRNWYACMFANPAFLPNPKKYSS